MGKPVEHHHHSAINDHAHYHAHPLTDHDHDGRHDDYGTPDDLFFGPAHTNHVHASVDKLPRHPD